MSHGSSEQAPIGRVIEAILECMNPFAWAIFSQDGGGHGHGH